MTLRAVVVDDELRARRGLAALLAADPRVDVIDTCANADEAVRAVNSGRPDVLFLDIQMPGGSGFDVLSRIDISPAPLIVLVTAFEEYALQGFDVRAVDYLLKPFTDARLKETVDRLTEWTSARHQPDLSELAATLSASRPTAAGHLRRLAVRRPGRTEWIPTDDVEMLHAQADYVEVTTLEGRRELVRGPLSELERRLDPERFVRTHRSWLVQIDRVRTLRLRSGGSGVIEMASGAEVPVSARRRRTVEARLSEGSG